MEFTDYLSAVEDFLRTKEAFKCSSEEMDSFLQTLSIVEEVRDLVKETIMKNPPPTFKVYGETVSLSSCYVDSIRQTQNILQRDRTGKLGHIMQQIRKSLGDTQRKLVWEISTILEISGEESISVRVCEQKQRYCEAKVKMHHYLLLEGLRDVIACLSEIGKRSVEDVWKSCKTSSAPLAMAKVGMNISRFEKTLKSYPEAFHVEDGKVFLKDNPRITYSLILNHMQSAKHKLKDHLFNQGALPKNELFQTTSQLLSRAEILAVGEGMETFTFTLQSLCHDFLLIPPHMLVVAQGTSKVKYNPFISAVTKIKDFIRSENAGNGSFMSKVLTFVQTTLDPYEEAAVGNTTQKLRETIAAYPDHFSIEHDTVFIKSDDVILPDGKNLGMQNLQSTKLDQEILIDECSSDQSTEHSEDSAHCEPLDKIDSTYTDNDACDSIQNTEHSEDSTNLDALDDTGSPCTEDNACSFVQNTDSKSPYPLVDTGSAHTEDDACNFVQNTEHSEDLANPDPLNDTGSPCTEDDACSSVQNTELSEDLTNFDALDDTGSPCTADNACSFVQNTDSKSPYPLVDTGSAHTEDDACNFVQNTEHSEDLVNPDLLNYKDSPHTEDDTCSSVQYTEPSEDLANPESLNDTDLPHTEDDTCSSVQNTETSEDLANPESLNDTCSPHTEDDACSTIQNTEPSENLSNPDSLNDTGSPHTEDDACSSVQNTELSEDLTNADALNDAGSPHTEEDACSSVQNTEPSEDLANHDPLNDTGSPCTEDDACSSVQNTELSEDLTNFDALDDTGSPCTADNACSFVQNTDSKSPYPLVDTGSAHTEDDACNFVQNTEHSEDLVNPDLLNYKDSPHTEDDTCSSVQYTEPSEDLADPDSLNDTDLPHTEDDTCSSVQNTETSEDLANPESLNDTCSPHTEDDACSTIQNTEPSENLSNRDSLNDTGSPHTEDDACSSVQNTELSEDLTNADALNDAGSPHTEEDACSSVQNTEPSEDLANPDPLNDTDSPHTEHDTCSSVQNTELSEGLKNADSLNDAGLPHAEDDAYSSIQSTEPSEDLAIPDSLNDTSSPHTEEDACSSVKNTEPSEDLANPDPLNDTGSPHTEDDTCSSVQNTELSEGLTNADSLNDAGLPHAEDDACSSIQSTEPSEDLAIPDSLNDTSSPHTEEDACSSVKNTEPSEDLANPDPLNDTGSPHTEDDTCSSVQNSELSEGLTNADSLNDAGLSHTEDDACSSIQNTEPSEHLANPDFLSDTGSPNTEDDACSSVQNTKLSEDLTNADSPNDAGSPHTEDDACSSIQNTVLSEVLANPDSLNDTGSPHAEDDACSSVQNTEHSEDLANPDPLVDTGLPHTEDDTCGSVQASSLGQDEVESLGSETISDSESLHSGTSEEVEILNLDTALPDSTDKETVTILQDRIYFGELIQEFLSEATYPILSVSLSDGWFTVSLWDGHTFAVCLTLSPCDRQKIPGQSERIALDFLSNKSIMKVVFDGEQIAEINDAFGIKMVKVFDLKMAQSLIRPNSKKSQTLPDTLSSFGIDPCPTVEVCIGTIQAPVYGEVFSKEAILKLKETARWTMKQVPYLYQKMLGMMTSYQITKVSTFHDAEVEDQPVTSSKTSPEKSGPVTSSMQAKAGPEKPVSVHGVSSTSGDLDGYDNRGHVLSRNDPCVLEENLQHDLYGPEVDSTFFPRDSPSRDSRSRTTSRRSKKIQTTRKQEKSSHQVTKGMKGTTSQTAIEQRSSDQGSPMIDAKVLHYEDDAGKPTLILFTSKLANQAINPCQISHELTKQFGEIVMHDQDKFLEAFGICIKYNLKKLSEEDKSFALDQLTEVVMDVGRKPSARYYQPQNPGQLKIKTIGDNHLTKQDLKDFVEGHCSPVSSDRRTSIKDTLHRVGIMCNRQNEPVGLTALTKHAVLGCATPLFDLMNKGQSILFVGNPGVGKSAILREAARVINDVVMRRVVIVDTCNEIAGDGDIPHPAIGGARRVQLANRDSQPNMIREVVRNHSPLSVIIDEVVTEADAAAVLATRQRGIQVISSAPGQTLQDVILNPNLRRLSGGIQNMAMHLPNPGHHGNAGPIPTVIQRIQPAAFDILVEMHDRYRWIVHMDFTRSIDLCLQKVAVSVQERRVFLKEVSKDSNGIPQVMVRDLVVMYPL